MAKLHQPSKPSAAGAPRPADGADDLDVLFPPEITVDIAGEPVTFREYRFVQSLALDGVLQSIVEGAAERCAKAAEPSPDDLMAEIINHVDALPRLVAAACDHEPEWFDALSDLDGQKAVEGWLAANAGFFVRRIKRVLELRVKRALQAFGGSMSSAVSSKPDTDSGTSGNTRNDR